MQRIQTKKLQQEWWMRTMEERNRVSQQLGLFSGALAIRLSLHSSHHWFRIIQCLLMSISSWKHQENTSRIFFEKCSDVPRFSAGEEVEMLSPTPLPSPAHFAPKVPLSTPSKMSHLGNFYILWVESFCFSSAWKIMLALFPYHLVDWTQKEYMDITTSPFPTASLFCVVVPNVVERVTGKHEAFLVMIIAIRKWFTYLLP